MKTKKSYTVLKIAIAVTSVIIGLTVSYAWFMYSATENIEGGMGEVKVTINEAAEVSEEGIAVFEIINDSTIDTYMRMGWTPVYMDKARNTYLTKDISGIEIESAFLTDDNPVFEEMQLATDDTFSLNGYVKKMITMEDKNLKYFVVPAGTKITGQIKLHIDDSPYSVGDEQSVEQVAYQDEDTGLYIIFIPEALQATKNAVRAAIEYGWLESKADNQARAVLAEGGGY